MNKNPKKKRTNFVQIKISLYKHSKKKHENVHSNVKKNADSYSIPQPLLTNHNVVKTFVKMQLSIS